MYFKTWKQQDIFLDRAVNNVDITQQNKIIFCLIEEFIFQLNCSKIAANHTLFQQKMQTLKIFGNIDSFQKYILA